MIDSADVAQVSKNVAIGGGIWHAISAIVSSEITPGPLGIEETSPRAEAPQAIAARASSKEAMQQILIRGGVFIGARRYQKPNQLRQRLSTTTKTRTCFG